MTDHMCHRCAAAIEALESQEASVSRVINGTSAVLTIAEKDEGPISLAIEYCAKNLLRDVEEVAEARHQVLNVLRRVRL